MQYCTQWLTQTEVTLVQIKARLDVLMSGLPPYFSHLSWEGGSKNFIEVGGVRSVTEGVGGGL